MSKPRKSLATTTTDKSMEFENDVDDDDEDIDDDDDDDTQTFNNCGTNAPNQALNSNASQKIKRGRKMTIMTKDIDEAIPEIIDTASNVSIHPSPTAITLIAVAAALKKRKRGRKSTPTMNPPATLTKVDAKGEKGNATTTSATSDEDEECSALNCIRPTGN